MHVLKSILKGGSALLLVIGLAVRFAPATEAEIAALGPDPSRTDLMMKRTAWAAMRIAPDTAVGFYARATGLPEEDMPRVLTAISEGTAIESAVLARGEEPVATTTRRTEAGGAVFVTAEPRN